MSLPNPAMSFTPFDPLPASDLNDLVENIEALADGTGFDLGAILTGVVLANPSFTGVLSGWVGASETWTYASSDTAAGGATSSKGVSTYTFTISGDKTTKYSPGMRLKLTQTTDKFFIITKVDYSAPNTTITCFGGTDYELVNAAITNPFYSSWKAPFGFPLDPTKWTVLLKDTSSRNQSSPAQNTWYNPGSMQLTVPIGAFELSYNVALFASKNSTVTLNAFSTLSTANNTESDVDFTHLGVNSGASGNIAFYVPDYRTKIITVTSKTTYYLNTRTTTTGGAGVIGFDGSLAPIIVQARCAFL